MGSAVSYEIFNTSFNVIICANNRNHLDSNFHCTKNQEESYTKNFTFLGIKSIGIVFCMYYLHTGLLLLCF